MKYYLIAGERSGDLHGANLMKQIKLRDPEASFRFYGGDQMAAQGGELVHHYKEFSFMGFWEIIANLRKIFGYLKACKKDILSYQPDVVIFIDFAGFNMRIAKYLKSLENPVKTFYYISPKIWAWNVKRAFKIKAYIDRMFVILPFEKDFYRQFDYEVDYVGNPLLDAAADFKPQPGFREKHGLDDRPIIAILPGSRVQELENMLHMMMTIVNSFDEYQFVIAGVSNLSRAYYEQFLRAENIRVVYNETYDVLHQAGYAIVTSGTATLETALFKVPQVVCYKTSFINATVVRMVLKVKYISLVNLIAGKEVVRELIQGDFNSHMIRQELINLTQNESYKQKMLDEYDILAFKMGEPGASGKAAGLMVQYLEEGLPVNQ